MADLVSDGIKVESDSGISKILNNPMFEELQSTLIDDLNLVANPFSTSSLGHVQDTQMSPIKLNQYFTDIITKHETLDLNSNISKCDDLKDNCDFQFSFLRDFCIAKETENSETESTFDLIVEDATLQAEFKQLSPSYNDKVQELEKFYNAQCASLLTQRGDYYTQLRSRIHDPMQFQEEVKKMTIYFDKQQEHLIVRVSQSLQLLKRTIPAMPSAGPQAKLITDPTSAQAEMMGKKSRMLKPEAVKLMKDWFDLHLDNPYPTEEEKIELAEKGGITLAQVKAWFANKRNRSLNTKPKRQKAKLANELSSICQKLVHAKQMGGDYHGAKGYNIILQELSSMIDIRPQPITPAHYSMSNPLLTPVNHSPPIANQDVGQGYGAMNVQSHDSPYPYYMSYNGGV